MKIDQKLLRALLKAGFPLKEVAIVLSEIGIAVPVSKFKAFFPHAVWLNGKFYLPPTLEAAFNAIKSYKYLSLGRSPNEWSAEVTGARATGKTPLEVLLKLYLKTRKK